MDSISHSTIPLSDEELFIPLLYPWKVFLYCQKACPMQNSIPFFHLHQGAAKNTFHRADIVLEDRMVQINPMSTANALDLHFLILLFATILMAQMDKMRC